jgi:acyl carrier protein
MSRGETGGEDEVLAGIAAVARSHLAYDGPLTPETRLVEDLELDSIRMLTLATEVENWFRVALEPEDEERIVTVGDLVAAVRDKLARAETPSRGESA